MKELESQETQQEFFAEFSKEPQKPERFTAISRPQKPFFLSISAEQMILVAIIAILLCCFVFFLGILRGKALATKEVRTKEPVAAYIAQPSQLSRKNPAMTVPTEPVQGMRPKTVNPATAPKDISVPAIEHAQKMPQTPNRSDTTKPYAIQLVTYKRKDLAEKEVTTLKKSGFYSFIIPSGDYYQICAGQYASKEDAAKDLKTLAAKYKDSFLRRR